MNKEFFRKNRYLLGALALVVIILIAAIIERSDGTNTILLTVPMKGTQVILNNELYAITAEEGEKVSIRVGTGEQILLTAKPGYYPWAKELTVEDGDQFTFTSFNLSDPPVLARISENEDELQKAAEAFANAKMPTEEAPARSKDGAVEVYVKDDTQIIARPNNLRRSRHIFCMNDECPTETVVIDSISPINGLVFLGNRNDVVAFSNSEGVFALEISQIGIQNFQPLSLLPAKNLALGEDDTLYALTENGPFILPIIGD